MPRKPFSEALDAELAIPAPKTGDGRVYALFKRTWSFDASGTAKRIATEPLLHDARDPEVEKPKLSGSDFWTWKPYTDVIVQGSAIPKKGVPTTRMVVRVVTPGLDKRLLVTGPRAITWVDGSPVFDPPQTFDAMPMTWAKAYGGIDWRVPITPTGNTITDQNLFLKSQVDHPAMYPRNPFGMGYVVQSGPVPEFFAPNVEDPEDALTPERLITGDPAEWWRQPLPWCLDWVPGNAFPRLCWFGDDADAWFPATDQQLKEVARGYVPRGFRDLVKQYGPGMHARWLQGASHGMLVEGIRPGARLSIDGMHPDGQLDMLLPDLGGPVKFVIEGKTTTIPARIHHLVLKPNERTFSAVCAADLELPRPFIPGIHAHIPITAQLAGEAEVSFPTPPTLKSVLEQAQKK